MKKIVIFGLLLTCGCAQPHPLTRQQQAEETVKKSIIENDPSYNVKDLTFSKLNADNSIEVYSHDKVPTPWITWHFYLSKDLKKVEGEITQ